MKTTTETMHLEISVGVQALQRYPAGCSIRLSETCVSFAYMFVCINIDAASDPQLYYDAS